MELSEADKKWLKEFNENGLREKNRANRKKLCLDKKYHEGLIEGRKELEKNGAPIPRSADLTLLTFDPTSEWNVCVVGKALDTKEEQDKSAAIICEVHKRGCPEEKKVAGVASSTESSMLIPGIGISFTLSSSCISCCCILVIVVGVMMARRRR